MPRAVRALLLLAALGLVSYLLISLYLPSSHWLIFGVGKSDGHVRMVGDRVTFLPPFEFYRLKFEKRDGFAQGDGLIRITSKEGVPVTVNYRLRFGIAGDHIPDAGRIVAEGWSAWIRARVSEAVSAVTTQIPIEELLSPTSQFNSQRDPLRRVVAAHLGNSGLRVTAFEIARVDVDRDALLHVKRAELRRDARSAPGRVALFTLDGADWELLTELANDGRIPNLKALMQGGSTGSVQTIQPTVSPMLWTTVATGLPPDRHGVIDFVDRSQQVATESYARRAPALWDIADSFGRSSMVVDWWTAWPPAQHDNIVFDEPVELVPQAVYPPDLGPWIEARKLVVPVDTIQYNQIRRFLNISPDELDKAINSRNAMDPINVFRNVLAKTWTDHQVAINVYNDQRAHNHDPLLLMMSYEGTDAVNHLFAPFHPPYREGVSQDGYRKFWPAVANYYSEIDRLIGEWMNVLPRDTTVIIMSAHGFRWDKTRPHQIPNGAAALSDHRNPGIFIAYGPHVAASRAFHPLSIFDVAPTVLTLLGLPKSQEMPGSVATWAFRDVTPLASVPIVSYGEFVNFKPLPETWTLNVKAYQAALQAIGHLNDATRNAAPVLESDDQEQPQQVSPQTWGAYAYDNNLGAQLAGQGKFKDAMAAFDQAIQLNPQRPTPYLNEAILLFNHQQYTAADEQFIEAVKRGLPNAETWFIDFAALYREHDAPSRAINLLFKAKELFPQSYEIAANLGSALVAASRYTEGVPELERALGLQPSSTLVLNNLGIFYAKKNDYARALDYWNRSLSIDPHQAPIRAAADAARTRL